MPVALAALVAAAAVTRPRLLSAAVTAVYRMTGLQPRLFGRARAATRSMGLLSSPPLLATTLALGTVGWLAEGVALWLLLDWLGAGLPLATAIAIFVFATLAGGLTGAPGGVGGAEAAMLGLLALQGVPLEVAVPATAVIRVTTLWFAILLGLAAFPMAERASLRSRDALEGA